MTLKEQLMLCYPELKSFIESCSQEDELEKVIDLIMAFDSTYEEV